MADISTVKFGGITYNIKDADARSQIAGIGATIANEIESALVFTPISNSLSSNQNGGNETANSNPS